MMNWGRYVTFLGPIFPSPYSPWGPKIKQLWTSDLLEPPRIITGLTNPKGHQANEALSKIKQKLHQLATCKEPKTIGNLLSTFSANWQQLELEPRQSRCNHVIGKCTTNVKYTWIDNAQLSRSQKAIWLIFDIKFSPNKFFHDHFSSKKISPNGRNFSWDELIVAFPSSWRHPLWRHLCGKCANDGKGKNETSISRKQTPQFLRPHQRLNEWEIWNWSMQHNG